MIKLYPPKLFYCQNPFLAPDKDNVMEIKLLFEKAVAQTHTMTELPADETLVQLYSLYNQATKGDADMTPPENFNDDIEKAKYEAWVSLKGKSVKDAQSEYIVLVHTLKN